MQDIVEIFVLDHINQIAPSSKIYKEILADMCVNDNFNNIQGKFFAFFTSRAHQFFCMLRSQTICACMIIFTTATAQTIEEQAQYFESVINNYTRAKEFTFILNYMHSQIVSISASNSKNISYDISPNNMMFLIESYRAKVLISEYNRAQTLGGPLGNAFDSLIVENGIDIEAVRKIANGDSATFYKNLVRFQIEERIRNVLYSYISEYKSAKKSYIDYIIANGDHRSENLEQEYINIAGALNEFANLLYEKIKKGIEGKGYDNELEKVIFEECSDYLETIYQATEYNFEDFHRQAEMIVSSGGTEYIMDDDLPSDSPMKYFEDLLSIAIEDMNISGMVVREHLIKGAELDLNEGSINNEQVFQFNRSYYEYEMAKQRFLEILNTVRNSEMFEGNHGIYQTIAGVIEKLPEGVHPASAAMAGLKKSENGTIKIGVDYYLSGIPPDKKFGSPWNPETGVSQRFLIAQNEYLNSRKKVRDVIERFAQREDTDGYNIWSIMDGPENEQVQLESILSRHADRINVANEISIAVKEYCKSIYFLFHSDPSAAEWRIQVADREIQMPPASLVEPMQKYIQLSMEQIEQKATSREIKHLQKLFGYTPPNPRPGRTHTDSSMRNAVAAARQETPEPMQQLDGHAEDLPHDDAGENAQSSADHQVQTDQHDADTSSLEGVMRIDQHNIERLRQGGIELLFSSEGTQIDTVIGTGASPEPTQDHRLRALQRKVLQDSVLTENQNSVFQLQDYRTVSRYDGIDLADAIAIGIDSNNTNYYSYFLEKAGRRLLMLSHRFLRLRDFSGRKLHTSELVQMRNLRRNYEVYLKDLIDVSKPVTKYSAHYDDFIKEIELLPPTYSGGRYYAYSSPASPKSQRRLIPDFPEDLDPEIPIVIGDPIIADHSPLGLGTAMYETSSINGGNNELVMIEILPARYGSQELLDNQLRNGLDPSSHRGATRSGPSERYGMARYLGNVLLGNEPVTPPDRELSPDEMIGQYHQRLTDQHYQPNLETATVSIYEVDKLDYLAFMQIDKSAFLPGTAFDVHNIQTRKLDINMTRRSPRGRPEIRRLSVKVKVVQLRVRESIAKGRNVHLIRKGDSRSARDTLINVNDLESLGIRPSFKITETCQ